MPVYTGRKNELERFESYLGLLRQALNRGPDDLNPLEKEGAIRRFEFCLDLAWKAAREYLEDSGLHIAPVTPREVLRQAAAAGVINDGQVWIDMLDHRNLMAHNYDGVVISEVTYTLAARYLPAMEQFSQFLAPSETKGAAAGIDS